MNNTNTEKGLFPKVTVVTVTRNLIKNGREQYFRQCLESVYEQVYSNVEHIVIDGASNDGTLDILKEYQKKKWITYYSEPDNGIYDAMNKGIKKASVFPEPVPVVITILSLFWTPSNESI